MLFLPHVQSGSSQPFKNLLLIFSGTLHFYAQYVNSLALFYFFISFSLNLYVYVIVFVNVNVYVNACVYVRTIKTV